MQITAAMVKELRERTGAGMMECKQALVDESGDIESAVANLRKKGRAKADKRAGRIAAEGYIGLALAADGASGALVEINSETDFVAKQDDFQAFANAVARRALGERPGDVGGRCWPCRWSRAVTRVSRNAFATWSCASARI